MSQMVKYDLAVLGAGPAGHFGAIQASKAGKRVAVIEQRGRLGGNSTITGTIPSKALREAAMHLTGFRQRAFYGWTYRVRDVERLSDLTFSANQIVCNNANVFEDQLRRNGIERLKGHGSFIAPNQLVVEEQGHVNVLEAERVLIAVGSSPARPPGIDFDGYRVVDSNQILELDHMPDHLLVVGAGVIGVEYACIFAAIGCRVTLVHDRPTYLDFCDRQLVEVLKYHMSCEGVEFRMNEKVTDLRYHGDQVVASTASNKQIVADCVLFSGGRQGNTASINIEAAGLAADARGRVKVDDDFQTDVPGIYAAGDVIGFPALAATSREQGRRAICHAFDLECHTTSGELPFGIYGIPEISMFGPSEEQLTAESIPYEVGIARYREIARGQIMGDTTGLMKLLFDPYTLKLFGAHIIGEGATELIHIAQAVHAFGGTLDYLASNVFNYPTLAECYKVAALDGINRARRIRGCQQIAVADSAACVDDDARVEDLENDSPVPA